MQCILESVRFSRDGFLLRAHGVFPPGIHLVTGRVGSGKSTLGELMRGVLEPGDGRIIREGVGSSVLSMQFPEYHITTTTAGEEVRSWGQEPDSILRQAGLAGRADDDLLTFSRGELKRLHLSCLFAGAYDLMILDEPFAGLDDAARYWVVSRIGSCRDRIIVIISHDITTLPGIDHLWEMDGGALRHLGPVPQALAGWEHAPPLLRYLRDQGISLSGLSWEDLAEAVCRIPG